MVEPSSAVYTSRLEARAVAGSGEVKERRAATEDWQAFQVGTGTVSLSFRSTEVTDEFVGDIWAGKTPGELATRSFRGLALALGEPLPETSGNELPRFDLGLSYQYRTLPDDGPAKSGDVEYKCDESTSALDAIGSIWCDTRAFALHPETFRVWVEEKPDEWVTVKPLLLGNGQDYLGRFTRQGERWQRIEWVHDSAWGGDGTHRLVFDLVVPGRGTDD